MEEKIVTPRDYTFIELKREAKKASNRALLWGLIIGFLLGFVAHIMMAAMLP